MNRQPTLQGQLIRLRPLEANDFEELYEAASDPLIWEQHPQPTRYQKPIFQKYFEGAMQSQGALAIIDNKTLKIIGSSRYYDYHSDKSDVIIGYTFLTRSSWGGAYNQELKKLMLDYAFKFVKLVWFHVGESNLRSQKALEKIGAQFCYVMEKNYPTTTVNTFVYKITPDSSQV